MAQAQQAAADAARKKVVQQGRKSYYSLRTMGLDEFQSAIQPNWEKVLRGQNVTDAAQLETALKLLNGLHFTMVLDKEGKVTVNHQTDVEPPNDTVRKGFDEIYSGLDQAVSGFFTTWAVFMLNSPFPEIESVYQLEDLGNQYRLSYKEGTSDVVTLLSKDLVISEIKVTSPEFSSVVKPQMVGSDQGFLLMGYLADYTPASGPGVVHLAVKIENAPVSGLQLPVNLVVDSTLDGAPTHMELAFSRHQVKTH
jgi:hypothetical protein